MAVHAWQDDREGLRVVCARCGVSVDNEEIWAVPDAVFRGYSGPFRPGAVQDHLSVFDRLVEVPCPERKAERAAGPEASE